MYIQHLLRRRLVRRLGVDQLNNGLADLGAHALVVDRRQSLQVDLVHQLAVEGFVVLDPQKGARVATMDSRTLEEAYEVRIMLEGLAARRAVESAEAALAAVQTLEGYLQVVAPFAGRVTERLLHPGALVGPAAGPLVRVEQVAHDGALPDPGRAGEDEQDGQGPALLLGEGVEERAELPLRALDADVVTEAMDPRQAWPRLFLEAAEVASRE